MKRDRMRLGWIFASIVLLALLAAPAHAAADYVADEFSVVNELDPIEWNNKAVALYNLGRTEEAIEAYDRAIDINPQYTLAWNNKGAALFALGRNEEAIEAYDGALIIDPQYTSAWFNKGIALTSLGRNEEAIEAYDRAIDINPQYTLAWNNKGNALEALGRNEEAIDAYDRAIDINPQYTLAWNNKGAALEALGRNEEAFDAFDHAVDIDPQGALAWSNKGNALYNLGRTEEAIKAYDRALDIDQRFADAWNNKGAALEALGRNEEAFDAFDHAVDIDPQSALAWSNKGAALTNLGRSEDAIECFEKALDIDSQDAYVWSNEGYALFELKRYNDSILFFDKALKLDPKIPTIWNNKGSALESLNRSAEAAMAYSLGREMGLSSETKIGILFAFLIVYSTIGAGGYALTRRHRKYAISIAILSINLLGFLAIMWILSGFFDHLLVVQFFVGGVVMVVISTVLWSLSGFPANPWRNQLAQEIENFNEKCPRFSRFIRAIGLLSILSYASMAIIFYFRLHLGSESSMVDFLKIAFGSIFLLGLLVTLPLIWSAMISKNLDGRTRELLLIFQFGHLGLSGLYAGMILWIFGKGSFSHSLSLGDIKFPISIHSLGIVMFLFVLAVIIPYVSGSKRASKWNTTLFEKERRWLDELVDILDYPTPNLYVSKLQKVMAEIKGEDPISGQEEELDRIKSLYGAEVLRLDPRSRHREFSMKLQEQIAEMIAQFEEMGDEEEKIRENAPIYADAYHLRRDEITGMIEREGKFKPKFWIALAIILTPVLGQILATLINWILKAMIDTNIGGIITQTPVFPIPLPLP